MTRLKFVIFFILMLIGQDVFCQYTIDSISLENDLTKWYDLQVGLQNTVLQHGELFTLTRKSSNSHAYYEGDNWTKINITYCNQIFHDIPGIYNIEEDLLIVQNNLGPSFGTSPLKLHKERVSHFEIGAARFEYINEPVGWHQKGFFKMVYRGESLILLGKVFKKIEIKDGNLHYEQDHHYFLKKDGRYHRLKRLSGLTKLFSEHKRKIRQHKKQLSLRNIDNPANEDKLVRLIGYCDNLSKQ